MFQANDLSTIIELSKENERQKVENKELKNKLVEKEKELNNIKETIFNNFFSIDIRQDNSTVRQELVIKVENGALLISKNPEEFANILYNKILRELTKVYRSRI